MTSDNRTTIGAIGLTLGLVALMLIVILTALHAVGTDDALYFKLQTEAGILPQAGVSEEELRSIDRRLADYLRGDSAALEEDPPFNAREMTHMADCQRLFALLRKVRSRLIPWAVLLIVGGAYLLQNRRKARRCAYLAPLILLVPLGAFAIWAAVDFDGANRQRKGGGKSQRKAFHSRLHADLAEHCHSIAAMAAPTSGASST